MISSSIRRNLESVTERIEQAAARAGRDPKSITLVAVSKTVERDVIEAAYQCGVRCFGENRVQDALRKFTPCIASDISLHMIGQLQSNKASHAAKLFDMIESVDRSSLIVELDRQAAKLGKRIPVLLQVNIAGEVQKAGCHPDDALTLVRAIVDSPNLELEGLMAIAPLVGDPRDARPVFAGARKVRDQFLREGVAESLPILSMGMTNDFENAIEEGATHVRVGRALFTI